MAEEGSKNARELIEFGAEIVGAAAGGVIGFFAGGPGGAVGGAVAGPLLTKGLEIASDFALRSLSRRERIRAGAGLGFAYANINNRLARGKTPRDDGFFEGDRTRRPASDEILEGTLHKCMSDHEESSSILATYMRTWPLCHRFPPTLPRIKLQSGTGRSRRSRCQS